jgi:polar amino acid transport system permease protein
MSLLLTVIGISFGTAIGIVMALMKISKNRLLSAIASFYTWVLRGTPMMVQLYFLYFGLPSVGVNLKPLMAAGIGLSLNIGAYMAEIIRGGIQAVDKGQFEAAHALGMNFGQTMKRIIIPQTVRIIMPSVGNEFITLLKDTSLVAAITMTEILKVTYEISSATFKAIPAFAVAATLYLAMTTILTYVFNNLEKKMSVY